MSKRINQQSAHRLMTLINESETINNATMSEIIPQDIEPKLKEDLITGSIKTANFLNSIKPKFILHEHFRKSNGQRYRITGLISNPAYLYEKRLLWNCIEFQEVVQQKEMGEFQDILTGEVFVRRLESLYKMIEEKKIFLE